MFVCFRLVLLFCFVEEKVKTHRRFGTLLASPLKSDEILTFLIMNVSVTNVDNEIYMYQLVDVDVPLNSQK